jgi:hypothetical protein
VSKAAATTTTTTTTTTGGETAEGGKLEISVRNFVERLLCFPFDKMTLHSYLHIHICNSNVNNVKENYIWILSFRIKCEATQLACTLTMPFVL